MEMVEARSVSYRARAEMSSRPGPIMQMDGRSTDRAHHADPGAGDGKRVGQADRLIPLITNQQPNLAPLAPVVTSASPRITLLGALVPLHAVAIRRAPNAMIVLGSISPIGRLYQAELRLPASSHVARFGKRRRPGLHGPLFAPREAGVVDG